MTFGEKIYSLRTARGMTQDELARKLGYRSRSSIAKIENGERDIPRTLIGELAKALGADPAYLMGWKEENTPADTAPADSFAEIAERYGLLPVTKKRFPMLGEIACGEPIFANEDKETCVTADCGIDADFCLRAKGDSMINARILDGDIVFIKAMPLVDNGDIAAVVIEDEATLKRVYYSPDKGKLILTPENSRYEPLVFTGEELDHIRILGKAVGLMTAL